MKVLKQKSKQLTLVTILLIIYFVGFFILENIQFDTYIYTQLPIDQYIPFIDWFVIPYVLWGIYIVLGFVYFLFKDEKSFYRTCFYLFAGMYICLIVYALFPNAQGLRVEGLDPNNFLQSIILSIYQVDTCTNVCPSIHVYNSIMMYLSLSKCPDFKKNIWVHASVAILTILICLSTMLIKQHAFIDSIWAILLCVVVYLVGKYRFNY